MAVEKKCENCRRFGERVGYGYDSQGAFGFKLPGKVCRLTLGPDTHTADSSCDVLDIAGPDMHAFMPTLTARIRDVLRHVFSTSHT